MIQDPKEVAESLSPLVADAVRLIHQRGRVSTVGWEANWFSVLMFHRKDDRVFTGFSVEEDTFGVMVQLTEFGKAVAEHLGDPA